MGLYFEDFASAAEITTRGRTITEADVVMFAQTAFTKWPDDPRWLDAALASYAVNAPLGALDRVRRLAWWLTPLGCLAAAMALVKPNSRELRAVGLTLARLRRG